MKIENKTNKQQTIKTSVDKQASNFVRRFGAQTKMALGTALFNSQKTYRFPSTIMTNNQSDRLVKVDDLFLIRIKRTHALNEKLF